MAPRTFTKENVSKRRNTMNKESKKIEKKAEQTKQEVKPAELSEQELDKVAGGAGVKQNESRSNTRNG
jgi:hypothetical protein